MGTKTWERAGAARRDLADLLDGLDSEQWAVPTYCDGWNVRLVAGHVLSLIESSTSTLLREIVKARGRWNDAAPILAARAAERSPAEIVEGIRDGAERPLPVPGAPELGTVADVSYHIQDIRRPLGLPGGLDDETVRVMLHVVTHERNGRYIADPAVFEDLRLVAPDVIWSHGFGPEVVGPGEALAMAVSGRPTLDELSGDGLDELRRRLA